MPIGSGSAETDRMADPWIQLAVPMVTARQHSVTPIPSMFQSNSRVCPGTRVSSDSCIGAPRVTPGDRALEGKIGR